MTTTAGDSLSGGNTPDYMNRSIRSIALQDETAAPFRIVRTVLDHESPRNPSDDITNPHGNRRQLFESKKQDSHFAACDQRPDLLDGATRTIPSE